MCYGLQTHYLTPLLASHLNTHGHDFVLLAQLGSAPIAVQAWEVSEALQYSTAQGVQGKKGAVASNRNSDWGEGDRGALL